MLSRSGRAGLAIALVVTLTACVETTRLPAAEPSPSVAPLFASDEEALAAATEAYEEYLAVSEEIAANPPFLLDALEDLTTPAYLEKEAAVFKSLEDQGLRISGRTSLADAQLQQWFTDPTLGNTVIFYACLDISGAQLIDAEGVNVTSDTREELNNLEVEMIEGPSGRLLMNRSEQWFGEPVC